MLKTSLIIRKNGFPCQTAILFEVDATGLTKIFIFAAHNWKKCQKITQNVQWHKNRWLGRPVKNLFN